MKHIFLIIAVFCASLCDAQNLLLNPSFEITAVPKVTPLYLPANWISPNTSSPDLLTSLNTQLGWNVPQNFSGHQFAHTGEAYIGLLIYSLYNNDDTKRSRDYFQNEITETLVQDSTYCLQLFVSLADSSIYASKNKLGVYFSSTRIQSNDRYYLPFTPQIMVSPNTFIEEKQVWLQFNFNYKAEGGEKYMTIGNFTDSAEVDTLNVDGGIEIWNQNTYYYIDDVYLGSCDSIPFDTNVGLPEQSLIQRHHNLFPNPATNQVSLAFVVRSNEQFNFLLYDLQGSLVHEQQLQKGQLHHIPLEQIKKGLYLYQVRNDKGEFLSGKLIIE